MVTKEHQQLNNFTDSLLERPGCALCGSYESKVHIAFRDIPVVRCANCGFLYSSRTLNADAMHGYYQNNFGSQRHLEGQQVNARTNGVVIEQVMDLGKIRSWLDVGCGYGFLNRWLRQQGIETVGVELSGQEADYAKAAGLDVHNTPLSDSGLPLGYFDVVSSFEVIEHVSDPKGLVAEMASYVRPGGHLIVMTDNFESTAAKHLRGDFPKWIPHSHVNHFSGASLRRCIQSVPGLTIEKEAAYTPWDIRGRQLLRQFRSPVADEDAFDLPSTLSTEMGKKYKFFKLRYRLNPVWTRLTLQRSLDEGALMYAICRKA